MPFLIKILIYLNNLFFSLIIGIGEQIFLSGEKLINLHIKVNNFILKRRWIKAKSKEILILAPHCLQNSNCNQKILRDINNCLGCGRCNLKDLGEIYKKYQLSLSIVTGGSLAKEKVKEKEYQGVIAIACEKEIEEGIRNSFPTPVFAVVNNRPKGPCQDTKVDINKVMEGIRCFI
jgi:hypothetical protein